MKLSILVVLQIGFSITAGTLAFADCSLVKITQMPLVELGNHYAVMVKINDVMRPMIVDTGAETTTLNSSAADKLDLLPDMMSIDTLRPVVGIGQTKAELYLNVIPSVFGLGDLIYKNRSTVVANMGFEKTLKESASIGLIGDDILSQYDVEFDFPANQVSFYTHLIAMTRLFPGADRLRGCRSIIMTRRSSSISISTRSGRGPSSILETMFHLSPGDRQLFGMCQIVNS